MHWELWIVPVIALFVWIISQLRSEEPPKAASPPEGGGSPRPGGEVEKFLQELDRMRRKTAAERMADVRPAPPPAESIPEVIPVAQPVSVAQVEPVRPAPPPVARPQKPKTRTRPRPTQAARPAPPKVVSAPPLPAIIPVPPVAVAVKSGAVAQVRSLLRTPEAVQTAFVLHEILGPPRCYKRERG